MLKIATIFSVFLIGLIPCIFCQSYAEGPDLPGFPAMPPIIGFQYTVAAPNIVISGQLNTPGDGQERFEVIVPAGCEITGVNFTITDPATLGITGFFHFNTNNDVSYGPGASAGAFPFATQFPNTPFPVGPGTYYCMAVANIAWMSNWTMTFHTTCGAPLPVEMMDFSAVCDDKGVSLRWATATEINNDEFLIEWTRDGESFSELARINGSGNSTEPNFYSFNDHGTIRGTKYYRISSIDFDGSKHLFDRSLALACPQSENPLHVWFEKDLKVVHIELSSDKDELLEIVLMDDMGRVLKREFKAIIKGDYEIELSAHQFSKGVYLVHINGETFSASKRLILLD